MLERHAVITDLATIVLVAGIVNDGRHSRTVICIAIVGDNKDISCGVRRRERRWLWCYHGRNPE